MVLTIRMKRTVNNSQLRFLLMNCEMHGEQQPVAGGIDDLNEKHGEQQPVAGDIDDLIGQENEDDAYKWNEVASKIARVAVTTPNI